VLKEKCTGSKSPSLPPRRGGELSTVKSVDGVITNNMQFELKTRLMARFLLALMISIELYFLDKGARSLA
jgi:hypothetical protein